MSGLIRILSLDGGGVRGIIYGEILIALEEKLRSRTGDPSARIADYFDLIAGTSTGGIFTALLLCPDRERTARARYSAHEVSDLLRTTGSAIFHVDIWQEIRSMGGLTDERYPSAPLENLLRSLLQEVKLSDLVRPCLVTAYDIQARRAVFFTRDKAGRDPKYDFYARDVARATSAAPALFEVANIRSLAQEPHAFIDGGVVANNPALCAYAEAVQMRPETTARQLLLLSLGPGRVHTPYPYAHARHWGAIEWLKPLLDIFMSGVSETVDFQLRKIFQLAGVPGQYLRLDPELDKTCSPDVDNATLKNLLNLSAAGLRAVNTYSADLDRFLELLLAH